MISNMSCVRTSDEIRNNRAPRRVLSSLLETVEDMSLFQRDMTKARIVNESSLWLEDNLSGGNALRLFYAALKMISNEGYPDLTCNTRETASPVAWKLSKL